MISDKEFLGFKWPPRMPSYPFKRKSEDITWVAYVYPNATLVTTDSKPVAKFGFDVESQARKWKKDTERSKNKPLVIVMPLRGVDEEGWTL